MSLLKIRVRLEPELEELAASWSPEKRRVMAKKLRRWARQLDVSAHILTSDHSPRQPSLKVLPHRKTVLN